MISPKAASTRGLPESMADTLVGGRGARGRVEGQAGELRGLAAGLVGWCVQVCVGWVAEG